MKLLEQVQRGVVSAPRRTVIYGVGGVGKSTFASMAPRPIFIPTEDGLAGIDCHRFPLATSVADVIAALAELYTEPHEYQTVVIDSLDWLQTLVYARICKERGVESIEDIPYGKGYVFALTPWREVLAGLDALRNERGMGVILIAHAQIERFADPRTDTYDRYPVHPSSSTGTTPGAGATRCLLQVADLSHRACSADWNSACIDARCWL